MAQPSAQDIGLPQLKQLVDKNFWSRPEGKIGRIALAIGGVLLLGGLIVSLPAILTYLLFIVQTSTQILLHLGFLAATYAVVTNRWIRALAGSMFRSAVRSAVSIFVNMAPVAVARDFIAYSRKKLASGQEAAKRFKAKMGTHMQVVGKFRATLEEYEALAKSYNRKKQFEEAQAAQVRAERTRKRLKALEEIYAKMETLARALDTILKKAKLKVDNTEAELEDQITMFTVAMDAKYAMADVKEAIGATGSTRKEMADMAAARMAIEVAEVVVEIDEMIQLSEDLFSGVDAQEAVISERAMKRFQQWEQESQSSVFAPGEKAALLQDAYDTSKPYDINVEAAPVAEITQGKKFNANDFFSS